MKSNQAFFVSEALRLGKASRGKTGALIVNTGKFTGRAAKERFVSDHPDTHSMIEWNAVNQSVPHAFATDFINRIGEKLTKLGDKAYSFNGYVGPFKIKVTSTSPWHIAFCQNMFRDTPSPAVSQIKTDRPIEIEVMHDPEGTMSGLGLQFASETAIILDPAHLKIGITGTAYAGEIKKGAFTLCNFLLPQFGLLPMHSSANCLADGSESCVLFGLSGTGKTTLSASADRYLIGDDEILWSHEGLSNLEGGCYAKLIDLTAEREPEIFSAINQEGAIMENVVVNSQTGTVDYADRSRTENTRGSYPLTALPKVFEQSREAVSPKTIVFLTADAFGAMPAVARLNSHQAQYYFLSGYTAKVAGTELGVKEPQAAFSVCFGAPFMPRPAGVYAKLLSNFMTKTGASVWLLNTGWQEGGYGKSERFPLKVSRRLLSAIQSGELAKAPMRTHPIFGFEVPTSCPGLESSYLRIPEGEVVRELAKKFDKNIRSFKTPVPEELIRLGGPKLTSSANAGSSQPGQNLAAHA